MRLCIVAGVLKLLALLVIIVFASGGLRTSSRIRRPLLHVFLCFFRGSLTSLFSDTGASLAHRVEGKLKEKSDTGTSHTGTSHTGTSHTGTSHTGTSLARRVEGRLKEKSDTRLLVVTRGCSLPESGQSFKSLPSLPSFLRSHRNQVYPVA